MNLQFGSAEPNMQFGSKQPAICNCPLNKEQFGIATIFADLRKNEYIYKKKEDYQYTFTIKKGWLG